MTFTQQIVLQDNLASTLEAAGVTLTWFVDITRLPNGQFLLILGEPS